MPTARHGWIVVGAVEKTTSPTVFVGEVLSRRCRPAVLETKVGSPGVRGQPSEDKNPPRPDDRCGSPFWRESYVEAVRGRETNRPAC